MTIEDGRPDDVKSHLMERSALIPVREREAGFGIITEFNDGSRLYQFNGDDRLQVYLTKEGLRKRREMPREAVMEWHKTGRPPEGKVLKADKKSVVEEYQELGTVGKTTQTERSSMRPRRLEELERMRKLARQISEYNKASEDEDEMLRLETPGYFGFMSWDEEDGKHTQVLLMEKVEEKRWFDMEGDEWKRNKKGLEVQLAKAERAGIRIIDPSDKNVFVKEAEGGEIYILIDQAVR